MTDTQQSYDEQTNQAGPESRSENPWEAIAADFQTLGQNIAGAIKKTWNEDDAKRDMRNLRSSLQNAANQVANAVEEAMQSPTAANAKEEVKKAAGDVKDFGEKAYTDSKPHLLNALKSLEAGLQSLISNIEERQKTGSTPPPESQTDK